MSPNLPTDLTVVRRADSVTAIFDQPQIVLFAKGSDCIQVEWIAERMRDHHGTGSMRERGFELGYIDVVGGDINIHKNRNKIILKDRVDGGGETCRNRDHFIAGFELSFAQGGRCEAGQRQ